MSNSIWSKAFWKVTAERMVRSAAITVGAVFFGGDKIFDLLTVNSWADIGALALSGAVGALLFCLGGNAITGNGPAFNKTENITEQ